MPHGRLVIDAGASIREVADLMSKPNTDLVVVYSNQRARSRRTRLGGIAFDGLPQVMCAFEDAVQRVVAAGAP